MKGSCNPADVGNNLNSTVNEKFAFLLHVGSFTWIYNLLRPASSTSPWDCPQSRASLKVSICGDVTIWSTSYVFDFFGYHLHRVFMVSYYTRNSTMNRYKVVYLLMELLKAQLVRGCGMIQQTCKVSAIVSAAGFKSCLFTELGQVDLKFKTRRESSCNLTNAMWMEVYQLHIHLREN